VREVAKRGKKLGVWALPPLALLLLAGCGSTGSAPPPEPDYRDLVDDFAVIALQKERENLRFERALALVGDYLEGSAGALETDGALEQIYTEIMAEYTPLEQVTLSPELEDVLVRYGTDPVDYVAMADERIDNLYADGLDLYSLRAHVLAEDRETLAYLVDLKGRFRALQVEYDAWAVNYLFYNWTGEELDYVNGQIVDQLAPEHRPVQWLTDREEIERQVTACLDRWEEYAWEFDQYVEGAELELERVQQQRGAAAPAP